MPGCEASSAYAPPPPAQHIAVPSLLPVTFSIGRAILLSYFGGGLGSNRAGGERVDSSWEWRPGPEPAIAETRLTGNEDPGALERVPPPVRVRIRVKGDCSGAGDGAHFSGARGAVQAEAG